MKHKMDTTMIAPIMSSQSLLNTAYPQRKDMPAATKATKKQPNVNTVPTKISLAITSTPLLFSMRSVSLAAWMYDFP